MDVLQIMAGRRRIFDIKSDTGTSFHHGLEACALLEDTWYAWAHHGAGYLEWKGMLSHGPPLLFPTPSEGRNVVSPGSARFRVVWCTQIMLVKVFSEDQVRPVTCTPYQ